MIPNGRPVSYADPVTRGLRTVPISVQRSGRVVGDDSPASSTTTNVVPLPGSRLSTDVLRELSVHELHVIFYTANCCQYWGNDYRLDVARLTAAAMAVVNQLGRDLIRDLAAIVYWANLGHKNLRQQVMPKRNRREDTLAVARAFAQELHTPFDGPHVLGLVDQWHTATGDLPVEAVAS